MTSSMVTNPELWMIWIRKLCSLFDQMSESDQKEYMELHNNFFVPGSTPTEIGKVILDFCLAPDMVDMDS